MNWENEETNYEKQKKAKTSSSNGVLLCPFCGEAPKQPYQTGLGLYTYCSSIPPKDTICPISGIPMHLPMWNKRA